MTGETETAESTTLTYRAPTITKAKATQEVPPCNYPMTYDGKCPITCEGRIFLDSDTNVKMCVTTMTVCPEYSDYNVITNECTCYEGLITTGSVSVQTCTAPNDVWT